ncbi:hypothetical protein BGZ46_009009 [Entomortierella lignicola]|nr:hypothetical protein BGZ46_009009 [Entomortierella lignicola]
MERAVRNILTDNDPSICDDHHQPLPPQQKQQPQRRTSRPRTLSSPVQPRVKPLEHLTDMGPLELEREIDSGVHLTMDSAIPSPFLSTSNSATANTTTTAFNTSDTSTGTTQPLQQLSNHPSTSTLVSETSHSSLSSATTTKTTTDQDTETEGIVWSGAHPLLADHTTEPDILPTDNNDYNSKDKDNESRLVLRNKGHSMSVDVRQQTHSIIDNSTDAFSSGSTTPTSASTVTRRRNVLKANDDTNWRSHSDKNLGHGRAVSEASYKRVIIHQVTPSDTLAGIALYYGIQVPILKKSNKLWTNDSIHTRKYLYIPFEECTVTRQSGVLVDENNQTVLLPQRIQQQQQYQGRHHSRTGSAISPSSSQSQHPFSFTGSQISTYDPSILGPINNSLSSSQHSNILHAIMESSSNPDSELKSRLGTELDSENLSPPISAVTAGMLPSSSSSSGSSSSRMSTWIDAKSMAAPPVPSPTITTTTLKSDNSLKAAPLSALPPSSRQNHLDGTSRSTNSTSSSSPAGLSSFSEDLPDTVVVPSSMTHEALAARFKEMDIVSSEQQQRKLLGQEQELRINPIHQRHRTTDLRQFAKIVDSGKQQRSLPTSAAGSRRASVDVGGVHDLIVNGSTGGRIRGPSVFDSGENCVGIEEEDEKDRDDDNNGSVDTKKNQKQDDEFIAYGRHQHIYATDDLHQDSSNRSSNSSSEDNNSTLRRQELVTVPVGMLSYFPSSEHSKKLETPQSISRIQNQMEGYTSSLSSSSTSGSFRGALSSRDGSINFGGRGGSSSKTKGRRTLTDQTFQSPSLLEQQNAPSSSSDTIQNSPKTSAYSKALRVNQQQQQTTYFTPQKWSAMGESLVDDLLGAVRGPLQIARRVYNFTTLGFGSNDDNDDGGGSSNKDSTDIDYSSFSGATRRRTSIRGRSGKSQRNKEFRTSAIELNQAIFIGSKNHSSSNTTTTPSPLPVVAIPTTTTTTVSFAGIEANVTRRVPSTTSIVVAGDTTNSEIIRSSRRKSGSGHGNFNGSTGSTSSGGGSTRKRSLRLSNPVNHAALMALVNELDNKDKREKENEKGLGHGHEKSPISGPPSGASNPTTPPVLDILATSF